MDSKLRRSAHKAQQRTKKLEKAEKKQPKKKVRKPVRAIDPQNGRIKTRLQFEETTKKPPSAKLKQRTAAYAALAKLHREVGKAGEDNSGVEAANTVAQVVEGSVHSVGSGYHHKKLKPYRAAVRAERQADRANVSALHKEFQRQNGGFSSNPFSRLQQKLAIKREYAKAKKTGRNAVSAAQISAKAAEEAARESKRAAARVVRHRKGLLIAVCVAALIAIFLSMFSSCSVMIQGGISSVVATTYPSEDHEMLAAEARYCEMEAELQSYLDNYESTHSYDEYHYDLDSIEHDPYVLISAVTAYIGGEWTMLEAEGVLQMLFEHQYTLTETVTTEIRSSTVTNADGEEESEEYTYYICTVTLENFDLSHLPVYVMSEEQLSMYAAYMSTLGNRPDLFPGSAYVELYSTEYDVYEIPPEALEDEQFAAMITEAEKYLGFPYVWGGSSPSTSFDCSGFVSWVINHCGVGWDVGRLGATGLYNICTPVSEVNVRPGDLVFFEGTYDTEGMSHVGIYVGGGMMIHCGDPIHYESLETSYWQAHFVGFGRLPEA